jgi:hypothetical protein
MDRRSRSLLSSVVNGYTCRLSRHSGTAALSEAEIYQFWTDPISSNEPTVNLNNC